MTRRFARLTSAAVAAALALTVIAPALPPPASGPVRVRASELTHPVHGSHDFALPDGTTHIAIHWPGQPNAEIEAAFSTDGVTFGPPMHVELDEAGAAQEDGRTYGSIMTVDGSTVVRVSTDRPLPQVSVLALDAAGGRTLELPGAGAGVSANSAIPGVITRAGWGADESLRFDDDGKEIWTREYFPVQKLVVHHTAGRNFDPNPPATVRAIYYYHAVTRGWGDIGYHYLIDESGRIYEGRYSREYANGVTPTADNELGELVEGGHALSHNPGSMGISLLGTYTTRLPTAASRQSLVRMLAWASARHEVDPRGVSTYVNPVNGVTRTTRNIAGHRDYQSTACPGEALYDTLPSIRNAVAAELVERFGGADRWATAGIISSRNFPAATTVFVANGRDFPDALAGGPAAALLGAPLLLTSPQQLANVTRNEIKRLKPQQIYVLGGPPSVSDAVLAELAALAPSAARLSGSDRYETAAAISAALFESASAVLVASGADFPDALAGGPAAARLAAPLLLVRPDRVPAATRAELERLAPDKIYLLGGTPSVSEAVRNELATLAPGGATRLGGVDRFATAALVSSTFFSKATSVVVANGLNFPDALSGGPAAARLNAPMLLVRPTVNPSPTATELGRLRPMRVLVLGQTPSVSDGVMQQLRGVLGIK